MTDSAEDGCWACGSITEVLTERHHINLVFSKGIKDKVKHQKNENEKKSEMSKGSNNGMKDKFSLQLNSLFQRKPKWDSSQTCLSFNSELCSWKGIFLMEGRCRPSPTLGYRIPGVHSSCMSGPSGVCILSVKPLIHCTTQRLYRLLWEK